MAPWAPLTNFNDRGEGGPTEVHILYPKKSQPQNLFTQKKHYFFLAYPKNPLGPVHMEVGQPGRWNSPPGGMNFFAHSHGKILSWPLGCVLSHNHCHVNIRTCKPKARKV